MERIKAYFVSAFSRLYDRYSLEPEKAIEFIFWCMGEACKNLYPSDDGNGARTAIRRDWMRRFARRGIELFTTWNS